MKTGMRAQAVVLIVMGSALAFAQGLPDVGGRPFRPTWGVGTALRAEGGDGKVFGVEAVSGESVTLRHLSPSQLDNCYAEVP
jgi:hypothetical protein